MATKVQLFRIETGTGEVELPEGWEVVEVASFAIDYSWLLLKSSED